MKQKLRNIPSVDRLVNHSGLKEQKDFSENLLTFAIRKVTAKERKSILAGGAPFKEAGRIDAIKRECKKIGENSLKPMINATGVVLHTNLSRAPLGEYVLQEISSIIKGYSNLEFDLQKGKRGQRNDHISELIKFITNAEDAVVVNNNAAAVMMILKTFADGGEVIISRGELIEIGGSFRIPDIMRASGAKMVEVGTTNRTRISDYENAITKNTKVILKAHKSNYYIGGYTEEAKLDELVKLAEKHDLIFFYDMGSGLLRKPQGLPLEDEPDVRSTIKKGIDLVSFSGDKLLGGPQAGVICGKSALISKLAKAPMMRALRIGKLTTAGLSAVMKCYLNDEAFISNVPIFEMINRDQIELNELAEELSSEFNKLGVKNKIVASEAQVGGGTLPNLKMESKAVKIENIPEKLSEKKLFMKLLSLERPILAILREGNLLFDVHSIFEKDINFIAETVGKLLAN